MKNKLNLGCGSDYKEGWINLDFNKKVKADVYHDLNKFPYPFKDNFVEEVLASHVLEHFNDIFLIMDELYRICKPNAKITIRVPHWSDYSTYSDLTHYKAFSSKSFDYFEAPSKYSMDTYSSKAKFKINKKNLITGAKGKGIFLTPIGYILDFIINLNQTFTEMFLCKFIPVSQCWFTLRVVKNG